MVYTEGSIFVECRRGVWLLTVRGEHDLSTQPSLSEELSRVCAAGGPVVVDFSEAAFIDSSVLRALATATVDTPGETPIAVVAPSDGEPTRLLRLTGIDSFVRAYETCEAAMTAVVATPTALSGRA